MNTVIKSTRKNNRPREMRELGIPRTTDSRYGSHEVEAGPFISSENCIVQLVWVRK